LTEVELRHLYLDEGLTDAEIASLFGTYQVKISRLRAKWGISTIVKSDRFDLPDELSPRLRSILIGSMLGDGNLRRTGTLTAGYTEHHSKAQREYLDWKAVEWGPFFSKIIPSNKDDYLGFRMYSHGCRTLLPYWQLFYPSGSGDKTFANLEHSLVDDLALAVWFMDDGSRTTSYVRFSVGPDEASQRVQLRILRHLGLEVEIYGEGGDTAIHVQGRRSLTRFVDLVAPHIVPSLGYKLELVPRRAGPAPRDLLTPERLQPMLDRGLRPAEIGRILNVSRNSVRRGLSAMGVGPRRTGRPGREERSEYGVEEATALLSSLDQSSQSFLSEAVRILLRTSLPVSVPILEDVIHDAELLRKAPTKLVDGVFHHVSRAGSVLCARHFPHRWDARYRDRPSVRMAWYDEELVRSAVRFQLRVGDPVTPVRVFRALQVVVRGPTNFRPSLSKAIVEAFCPSGGLVLDPCAGYGGRAAGTLAAGRRYIGIDPHPNALKAHEGLRKDLGGELRFMNEPFEDVDLSEVRANFIFTSPPYFSVERYSDDPLQSWVRYKTWTSWVRGFLEPFVEKSWGHLAPGGLFCVNTKNIRLGRQEYPIADELQRIAVARGFVLKATLSMPIGRVGKDARSEPLFLFRA
jgi:hypothetical protein